MEMINYYVEVITEIYQNDFGILGSFIFIILESFFPPIPVAVFFGFNAKIYGMVLGFIISYSATIIGCLLSYSLFYYLSQNSKIKKIMHKNQQVMFYAEKFKYIKFSTLSVCLALPFLPAFAFNIAAGLVQMNYKKFLAAILIGKISIVLFWSYIGKTFIETLTDIKSLGWLLIILIVVYYLSKLISKKYRLED